MIDLQTLVTAEAHLERLERLVEKARRLYGFSESEAIEYIERIGTPIAMTGVSRVAGVERTE